QFDVLFCSGFANGGTMVRDYTGRFHFRCKVASALFVSFYPSEIVAARTATSRAERREREGDLFLEFARSASATFSPPDVDLAICGQARRFFIAALSRIFAAKT